MKLPFYRFGACALALLTLIIVSGCSSGLQSYGILKNHPEFLSTHIEIQNVPVFKQEDHQCGPAALAMVLSYNGLAKKPDDIAAQVYSPARFGSLQNDLVTAAWRAGQAAYLIHPTVLELLNEINSNSPVIVLLNLGLSWFPVWHYAVVVGYDLNEGEVFLHDGRTAWARYSLSTFERTWSRGGNWSLVVKNPRNLPLSLTMEQFLDSALGLERAEQYNHAADAYRAALERWPKETVLEFGLGNSYLLSGNFKESIKVFETALKDHPESFEIMNNYAEALNRAGRKAQAIHAARKAVALSGGQCDACVRTLAEVSQTRF